MVLSELYGSTANAKAFEKRVAAISAKFQEAFGSEPTDWFSSSGRAEIVGNHTDHNHGKVIVAAIGCDILAAVKKRDDDAVDRVEYPAGRRLLDVIDFSHGGTS